jgi:hypothetical protein
MRARQLANVHRYLGIHGEGPLTLLCDKDFATPSAGSIDAISGHKVSSILKRGYGRIICLLDKGTTLYTL